MQFTTIVVGASVFLQRIALPTGAKPINIVGLIGLGVAAIGLLRGTLGLSRARLPPFLLLCLLALLGIGYHQAVPNHFLQPPSLSSVSQFLVLTSFAVLSFIEPVSERDFFRRVSAILGLVAVAGILQFVLQFVGIKLFTFRGIVPSLFLFEDGYNQQIPLGIGSLLKSNGFFMLEPSVFSQFMAIGLIIEILVFRRLGRLALFVGGMVLSVAGTGWLVLASFLASAVFSVGRRGLVISVATLAALVLLAVAVIHLAPGVAAALAARMDEITRPATSGHLRFITPFWVLDDVLMQQPSAALLGIGGGAVDLVTLPYEFTLNTPVKIGLEYGLPALACYVIVLAVGRKTDTQRALTVPGMVLLLFTGGYQQLAPLLFPVVLLISVANLRPDAGRLSDAAQD